MQRFLFESLPTEQRLKILTIKDSELYEKCDEIETHLHVVYFCKYVRPVWLWLSDMIVNTVGIQCKEPLRLLMLDYKCSSKKKNNSLSIFIVEYINTMWQTRDEEDTLKRITLLKCKLKYTIFLLSKCYDIKKYFTEGFVNLNL